MRAVLLHRRRRRLSQGEAPVQSDPPTLVVPARVRAPPCAGVIFSNGGLDPWSSASVTRNASSSLVAINIPNASHHSECVPSYQAASPAAAFHSHSNAPATHRVRLPI